MAHTTIDMATVGYNENCNVYNSTNHPAFNSLGALGKQQHHHTLQTKRSAGTDAKRSEVRQDQMPCYFQIIDSLEDIHQEIAAVAHSRVELEDLVVDELDGTQRHIQEGHEELLVDLHDVVIALLQ